jgi:hypothetical protein
MLCVKLTLSVFLANALLIQIAYIRYWNAVSARRRADPGNWMTAPRF